MRIAVAGCGPLAAQVLDRMLRPDRQVTEVYAPSPQDTLWQAAVHYGLPIHTSECLGAVSPTLGGWDLRPCDLLVCAGHRDRLPGSLIRQPTEGTIGYHPSLLPLHRGRDAIKWAIANGDRVTGGTVYQLTEDLDRGPIYEQGHVFIRPDDTPGRLWERVLLPMGVKLLDRAVDRVHAGVKPFPQPRVPGSWEPAFPRDKEVATA
ncbi:MAG: methionyl-tRNA formyltransferase [Candidatus Dormibacteraeota bacterium]|nr:methionyl-tRNA formyltransferase [Candidatus Dormibacteraeota bacterium]